MLKQVLVILLGATLPWEGQAISAQVAHQHHAPRAASEYISVLEDSGRNRWQQPEKVVEKLGFRAGASVADLGAGSGYFTVRLARAVGPTGTVYAVDVDRQLLEYLARRAKDDHLENIQMVLADPDDPQLAPASVDLILICNTLHHISERDQYYPRLARALKPCGRLVNIDFHKRPLPLGPPVEMKIAKPDMIKEAEAAGFRLLQEFDFLEYQYFLVFERQG